MRAKSCLADAAGVTRNRAHRLAVTLADERLREEEQAALRAAIHSTCQRDRSAAQQVADVFRVDVSVVYRWVDGEIKNHPLRAICDLLDACLAAKGPTNPAALEPARLIRRRYLESDPDEAVTARAVTGGVASLLRHVSLFSGKALEAVDPCSEGGEEIDPETELPGLEIMLDSIEASVRELRLKVQARAGRGRVALRGVGQ